MYNFPLVGLWESLALSMTFFSDSAMSLLLIQDTPSILDWPLPQPSYDEVTTELEDQSEDQEVRSINKGFTEETTPTASISMVGRSESQSADLFQELQREVEKVMDTLFQFLWTQTDTC